MLELCIQDRNSCLIELCILYPVHNWLNTRRRAHKRLECQEYDAGTAPLRAALQHPPHLQGFNWCGGGVCHCLLEPWAHTQRLMSAHFWLKPGTALHSRTFIQRHPAWLLLPPDPKQRHVQLTLSLTPALHAFSLSRSFHSRFHCTFTNQIDISQTITKNHIQPRAGLSLFHQSTYSRTIKHLYPTPPLHNHALQHCRPVLLCCRRGCSVHRQQHQHLKREPRSAHRQAARLCEELLRIGSQVGWLQRHRLRVHLHHQETLLHWRHRALCFSIVWLQL